MIDILATMTPAEYRHVMVTLTNEGHGYNAHRIAKQETQAIERAEEILHTLRGTESRQ